MVSKGKEKRISFEAEGERRMRRRRKFSSNPSWVRVYELKFMEHLGSSLLYSTSCMGSILNFQYKNKQTKKNSFLKIHFKKGRFELTSDALKILPKSVMSYYCVWYNF